MKTIADLWNPTAITTNNINFKKFCFLICTYDINVIPIAIVCRNPESENTKKPNNTKRRILKKGYFEYL